MRSILLAHDLFEMRADPIAAVGQPACHRRSSLAAVTARQRRRALWAVERPLAAARTAILPAILLVTRT
jgi:hypothetical protein